MTGNRAEPDRTRQTFRRFHIFHDGGFCATIVSAESGWKEDSLNTLIIIRHAKSDWSYRDITDMERPLKKRGTKDAAGVAEKMRHMGLNPDYLVSSPARRALDTAGIMAEGFGLDRHAVSIAPSLYQGSTTDYINEISQLPEDVHTVCIFGHNPEISEFCSILAQQDMYLHTATAVVFDIAVSWRELETAEQFLILNPGS